VLQYIPKAVFYPPFVGKSKTAAASGWVSRASRIGIIKASDLPLDVLVEMMTWRPQRAASMACV